VSFNSRFPHYHPDITERTYLNSHGEFSVDADLAFSKYLRQLNESKKRISKKMARTS